MPFSHDRQFPALIDNLKLHLKAQGLQPGDRVAAYLPNIPEAMIAFLAVVSVGGVWSICAPDMGTNAVLDRFKQIAPKMLVACDGVSYGGRDHDRTGVVAELKAALPSVQHVLIHRNLGVDTGALPAFTALAEPLLARYRESADGDATAIDLAAQARRRLRNACLAALCRADARHLALARRHFHAASNLTDRLAALAVLVNAHDREADAALEAYAKRHAGDALVLDKWFALQATLAEAHTLARVEALTAHAAFRWTNPNNVYALLGAFALRNPRAFHRRDGAGYRFIAQAICRLDAVTPQVAARLATAFGPWRNYEPLRRALMRREIAAIAARADNSPDLADIARRSLAG